MSLFPSELQVILLDSDRVYLYNVTRPLLLSGRVSEIKKKSMYMHIPNAYVNVEIYNAHSACLIL